MRITLDHVTHTYQPGSPFQSTAIRDVTLTVETGDFLALIGHTGSGKTTLAQHMNGLLKPTSGRVLLDGADIHQKGFNMRDARRRVGLVFQYPEHQLFEESVARDVAFGPKNMGLSAEETDARVREAMARVGLPYEDFAERSPFELSGGQMRRAALAGVLAMRPETLLLDEPTAGLDPLGREELLGLIKRLHEDGTTVVMISHNMDDVATYCTRVVVMSDGRLAMDGRPEEIFDRGGELSALGLDVPQIKKLSTALRNAGLAFPDCYLERDAVPALIALLKGGDARV